MKKINILIAIICISLVTSCKSFLNVEPTNSTSSESSIKTAQDAQVAVNGLMSLMASSAYYGRNFLLYGDAKGGDFTIYSQGRGYDGLYGFNHSASSGNYAGFWNHMYYCILQTNTILENIAKIEKDSKENFSSYKGQALTARAFIYFDLVRLYGQPYNMNKEAYGVPNITATLPTTAQPTRAKVSENYTQILKDLKDGAEFMSKSTAKGYLCYYANLALQAKVNLYMENYDVALEIAETIIKSKKYTLYQPGDWAKSWTGEFGSESIFELAIYENEGDLGTGSLAWYEMCWGKKTNAMGQFLASNYFLNRLGEDLDDVRWGVMGNDEYWVDHDVDRFGACYKYAGSEKEMKGDKGSTSAVNIKVIRLSEIYLIAAEAALNSKTPDKKKAADYLNEIRKRAPNMAPATVATVSNDMILDECSKEFYAEGHRFFDMIRMNKKIEFNDDFQELSIKHRDKIIDRTFYKCILPISQDEMNVNPAIASQQNPGY
ncbi:MAG: RagB/SusD family nutrient uptake outer membrane protein [Bacteroidales bacterium]